MKKQKRTVQKRAVRTDWLWIGLMVIVLLAAWLPLNSTLFIAPIRRVDAQAQRLDLPQRPRTPLEKSTFQRLSKDLATSLNGQVSTAFIDLTSGEQYGYEADQPLKAASLYKVFVAHRALELIENGDLAYADTVNKNQTVRQCLTVMITESDNACGEAMQRTIDPYNSTPLFQKRGYRSTTLSGVYPKTSARDAALLLKNIFIEKHLASGQAEHLLKLLGDQTITYRIPAALNDSITVAHKTGDLPGLAHDVGIVRSGDTAYVLAVMTKNSQGSLTQTNQAIATYSLAIAQEMGIQ